MLENMSPSQRSQRARMAANSSCARTPDFAARTAPARDKFQQRFLDEVDPERKLPEAVRLRRAGYARKAYFSALALKSARARRTRRFGS